MPWGTISTSTTRATEAMRYAVALAVALSAACAAGEGASSSPGSAERSVVDGVTHVVNHAPARAAGDEWRIAVEPRFTIGVAEGEPWEMFSSARGALQLSDGSIVIPDGSNELRFFDAAGNYLRTAGRSGQGPCEFGMIGDPVIGLTDTIVADDVADERISVFASDGTCLGARPALQIEDHLGASLIGQLQDGSLIFMAGRRPQPRMEAEGASFLPGSLFRVGFEEWIAHRVLEIPLSEGQGEFSLEFASRSSVAVHADRIYFTSGERYEIDVFDATGTHLMRMARSDLPPAVTAEDIAAWRAKALANIERAGRAEREMQRFEAMRFADRFPAYSRLMVDAEGNVWAMRGIGLAASLPFVFRRSPEERFPMPDEIVWDIYLPDGTWAGPIAVRQPSYLSSVGTGTLILSSLDEAGVQRFAVHDLIKP